MFVHYRTQGLIIKKEDRGDDDQFFTIYSKNFGKLEIVGRAIRKIKSKLRSGADIFYLSDIEFIQGKKFKTLTDAILIEKFENLRKDLIRLRIAYKISETFNNLVRGQERDKNLWNLLVEVFGKLDSFKLEVKDLKSGIIYYYFFWNLVSTLGYRPELNFCPLCRKKLKPENLFFNPKEGGAICGQCFTKLRTVPRSTRQNLDSSLRLELDKGRKIDAGIIKIIRILLKKDWQILKRLKISQQDLKELKTISDYFFEEVKNDVIGEF